MGNSNLIKRYLLMLVVVFYNEISVAQQTFNIDTAYAIMYSQNKQLTKQLLSTQNSLRKKSSERAIIITNQNKLQDSINIYTNLINQPPDSLQNEALIAEINLMKIKIVKLQIYNSTLKANYDKLINDSADSYKNQLQYLSEYNKRKESEKQRLEEKLRNAQLNISAQQTEFSQKKSTSKGLNNYIQQLLQQNLGKIKEIIVSNDFAIEKVEQLNILKANLPKINGEFESLYTDIYNYQLATACINETKLFLDQQYNAQTYQNLNLEFTTINAKAKLFTQEQAKVLETYFTSLNNYCEVNNYINNLLKKHFENLNTNDKQYFEKDLREIVGIDSQYTYLIKYATKLQALLSKNDFNAINSLAKLNNINCPSNERTQ